MTNAPAARGFARAGQSEAIRASAGSGKTYALTRRYLSQLILGVQPQSILATTFTRKAAGEILARILGRLARACLDDSAAEQLAGELECPGWTRTSFQPVLARFVQALHRVAVSTLDSWFQKLAQGFRLELGLPAEPRILEAGAPLSVQLRLEAVRQVLSGGPEVVALLDVLLDHQPRRSVQGKLDDTVRTLHQVYLQAPLACWEKLSPPAQLPDSERVQAIQALYSALPALDKNYQKAVLAVLEATQLQQWSVLLKNGLIQKVQEQSPTYYRKPIPGTVYDACSSLLKAAQGHVLRTLAEQTRAMGALLQRYDEVLCGLKAREQVLQFSDLPQLLASFVPGVEPSSLDQRLDGGIAHLLLDEFQDTSPEQWTILRPLAERVTREHGSLFIVGDVKQAIYGWRGGVAEIFDQLTTDLPSLQWASLARSFRSSRIVLEGVNQVFTRLTQAPCLEAYPSTAERWQSRFTPHEAARDLPGRMTLEVGPASHGEEQDEEGQTSGDEAEGSSSLEASPLDLFAAERIAGLAAEAPGASIGVLVRTNKSVKQLLFLLQRLGVQASGEGGATIDDDPAVEAILAAFTLADHPGDTVAGWHLRTSPLGLVVGLRRSPQDQQPPRPAGLVAEEIRRELIRAGYASIIADWMVALAPHCSSRSTVRLQQLLELAWVWDTERGLRPSAFVAFVRMTPVEEPAPARVRVMTVHKAKGLEFDVVVLLELGKNLLGHRPEVLIDRPNATGPVAAVYRNAAREVRALLPALETAHEQQEGRELIEGLCELYVAMTRARHALHMLVPARKALRGGGLGKVRLSHAAILRDLLGSSVEETEAGRVTLFAAGDPRWVQRLPQLQTLHPQGSTERGGKGGALEDLQLAPSSPLVLAQNPPASSRGLHLLHPSGLQQDARVTVEELLRSDSDPALVRGRLIHAMASRIAFLPEDFGGDLSTLPGLSRPEVLRLGQEHAPGSPESWAEGCAHSLTRALQQSAVRRVFQGPVRAPGQRLELWRERPFLVQVDRSLLKGIFDRVELLWEGERLRHAIIYELKSDAVSRDTRQALERRYQGQLDAYREALKKLVPLGDYHLETHLVWLSMGD